MPHLFHTIFLDGDYALKSIYQVSGTQVLLNLVLNRCSWRVCHGATAFLTSDGGQAFQEAVGRCVVCKGKA